MSRNSYQRSSCMLLLTSCHPSERLQLDWRLDGLVSSTPFFFFICLKPLWDSDGAKVKGSTGRRGKPLSLSDGPCLSMQTETLSWHFVFFYMFLYCLRFPAGMRRHLFCQPLCCILYSILSCFHGFVVADHAISAQSLGAGTMEVKS